MGVVCAVGLSSLENTAAAARVAVTQQLALIDDAAAMSAFQYQKGFVAEYLLSGNRAWLEELATSKPAFESWLKAAQTKVSSQTSRTLLHDIESEYAAYDQARKTAIALHDSGKSEDARLALKEITPDRSACATCFTQFGRVARMDAERALADTERNVREAPPMSSCATSIAGALSSLLAGFLWARRINQADRMSWRCRFSRRRSERAFTWHLDGAGLEALGRSDSGSDRKLEEADAALSRAQATPHAEREAVRSAASWRPRSRTRC